MLHSKTSDDRRCNSRLRRLFLSYHYLLTLYPITTAQMYMQVFVIIITQSEKK